MKVLRFALLAIAIFACSLARAQTRLVVIPNFEGIALNNRSDILGGKVLGQSVFPALTLAGQTVPQLVGDPTISGLGLAINDRRDMVGISFSGDFPGGVRFYVKQDLPLLFGDTHVVPSSLNNGGMVGGTAITFHNPPPMGIMAHATQLNDSVASNAILKVQARIAETHGAHPHVIKPHEISPPTDVNEPPSIQAFRMRLGLKPELLNMSSAGGYIDNAGHVATNGLGVDDINAVIWLNDDQFAGLGRGNLNAISPNGQFVAGSAHDVPTIWSGGRAHKLTDLSGQVLGINDRGEAVGVTYSQNGDPGSAFLWANGRMVDLRTSISLPSALELDAAVAINNRGVVLASGWDNQAHIPVTYVVTSR